MTEVNHISTLPRLALRRVANATKRALYPHRIDAVLVSYPKSGRTWFRFMMSTYLALAYRVEPAPDLHSMFTIMPNLDMDPVRGFPAVRLPSAGPRPPLIAVSHLPYSRVEFRSYPAIFMLRDPRDVMVSAYFHATRHKHRFSGGMDEFLADPRQGVASLTRYLNGWSDGLQRRDHVVVSYEELSRDPAGETARVLGFLGVKVDQPTLAAAVEAAKFQNMRELEQVSGLPGHDYDRRDDESLRMRRGKVGGFTDYLTPSQVGFIERSYDRELTARSKAILYPAGLWAK